MELFVGLTATVVLLDVSALVTIYLKRATLRSSPRLQASRVWLWVLGVVLAVASVGVTWPYDSETRILGFPLPGVVWELWTNGKGEQFWADFVGPQTLPLLAADFALCLFLPQAILAAILICRTKQNEQPNKPLQPTGSAGG
jgi:hypothetical protein